MLANFFASGVLALGPKLGPVLDRWAARIRDWSQRTDVFVYFDKNAKARAPVDAMALAARLGVAPDR